MTKSYLFFFVHPAKFHLFKNTINRLIETGNRVDILIISKDVLEELIKDEGWKYKNLFPKGRKIKFLPSKLVALFSALFTVLKLFWYLLFKKRYDKFITDDILVVPGYFLKVPTYFFLDNDYQTLSFGKYLLPFASKIIAPISTDVEKFNDKKISFKGNKAIAHLTPKYFTPNEKIVSSITKPFYLLRVAELNAVHDDDNNKGIVDESLEKIINLLSDYGQILISAERKLPPRYEKYRLKINPKEISHYMNYATMVITDSGTMATEAAVLGVPNILLNNLADKCGVHRELKDKFDLQYYYDNFEDVYNKVSELLSEDKLKEKWEKKKNLFIDYIDDFPELLYNELKKEI